MCVFFLHVHCGRANLQTVVNQICENPLYSTVSENIDSKYIYKHSTEKLVIKFTSYFGSTAMVISV